jgi:hypothetical protein
MEPPGPAFDRPGGDTNQLQFCEHDGFRETLNHPMHVSVNYTRNYTRLTPPEEF